MRFRNESRTVSECRHGWLVCMVCYPCTCSPKTKAARLRTPEQAAEEGRLLRAQGEAGPFRADRALGG